MDPAPDTAPHTTPGHTDELSRAHDVLADVYAELLPGLLERTPVERHLLALFAELVGADGQVLDAGCGTGRLLPHLAGLGLRPRGCDLSEEMVRVAARDAPGFDVRRADLRSLPYADASFDGLVCWYSLMYLPPGQRPAAYAELARVLRPGGHLVTAYKQGDDTARRGGETLGLGIGFDVWWHSAEEVEARCAEAGFETVLWAGRPEDPDEPGSQQPQGYLIARRAHTGSG
jgi:SAM-dependent methyltransferase